MTAPVRDAISLGGNVPVMSPNTVRQVPDGVPARMLSLRFNDGQAAFLIAG